MDFVQILEQIMWAYPVLHQQSPVFVSCIKLNLTLHIHVMIKKLKSTYSEICNIAPMDLNEKQFDLATPGMLHL
jgi:hypothetical protein